MIVSTTTEEYEHVLAEESGVEYYGIESNDLVVLPNDIAECTEIRRK